jgi:hypothetical protein
LAQVPMFAVVFAVAAAAATAPARRPPATSSRHRHSTGRADSSHTMVHSGTPQGVPPQSDCAIRQFAWEYGRRLQPGRGEFKSLFDALQLGGCGGSGVVVTTPTQPDSWQPPPSTSQQPAQAAAAAADVQPFRTAASDGTAVLSLVVDPVLGVDPTEDPGPTSGRPTHSFRSIAAAVHASRMTRRRGQPVHVLLRGGVHFLGRTGTIHLGVADAGMTIRNADGEKAVVSGGVNLTLTTLWKASARCEGCFEADLSSQGVHALHGLRRNGVREIRARYPNFDPEIDATIEGVRHYHNGSDGWISRPTHWVASGPGMNGIAPWPPVDGNGTAYVVRDVDCELSQPPLHSYLPSLV